jgi:hypothetical protein
MTEAIISDLTGKTVNKKQSYKVDIFSRGNSTHLEFDCEGNPELTNMLSVAVKNGCQWYKITKNKTTNEWERIIQDGQSSVSN